MVVGINKSTGKLKKGYKYIKGGKVVKAKKHKKKKQRGGGILKKTKKIGRFTVSSPQKKRPGLSFDTEVKVVRIPKNDCPILHRVRKQRKPDGSKVWGCLEDHHEFITTTGQRCCVIPTTRYR